MLKSVVFSMLVILTNVAAASETKNYVCNPWAFDGNQVTSRPFVMVLDENGISFTDYFGYEVTAKRIGANSPIADLYLVDSKIWSNFKAYDIYLFQHEQSQQGDVNIRWLTQTQIAVANCWIS